VSPLRQMLLIIPSGLQCQAFVYGGYIQVKADANAPVAGLQGTGSIGSVSIEVRARAEVTGVSATGGVGDVTPAADANVYVTGVSATGEIGKVLVWGRIVPNQNPSYTPDQPIQSPGWNAETPSQTPGWTRAAA
jgi:hypothetical protein